MTNPQDRRSSIRRPIHHDAVLKILHYPPASCVIADYCQEGMFVKLDTSQMDLSVVEDDHPSLELTFTEQGQSFKIVAKLVHAMKGAIGIRFSQQYAGAINALNTMNASGTVVSAEESQYIIEECILEIQKHTQPLMSEFVNQLVDELKQTSVKASSDQLANATMAAAEQIDKKSRQLQSDFLLGVKDPIGVFKRHVENSSKMSDSLSLVDKGEFEDWLVTRVLITKAETQFRSELLPLKVRLDAVGIGDKSHHQSVFGPALIVSAFHVAITSFGLSASLEKQIHKLFETSVLLQLEPLYKSLNQILIKHKVLPDLNLAKAVKSQSFSKSVPKQKTEVQKSPVDSTQENNEQEGGGAAGRSQDSFSPQSGGMRSPTAGGVNNSQGVGGAQGYVGPSVSGSSQGAIASLGGGSGVADSQSATFTKAPFQETPQSAPPQSTGTGAQADTANPSENFHQNQASAQSAVDNVVGLMRSLRSKSMEQDRGAGISRALGGETPPSSPAEVFSEQDLSQGLEILQASAEPVSLDNHVPLIDRVRENLKADDSKDLDDGQKVAIDVVDRFFYSMRNNPRINPEAKEHLLRLEVPVLKVLLKDERFFEDHTSSVRAVMNRIAQLGAKGVSLSPSSKRKVTELVQKIVEQFEQDTEIFDYVLSELDGLVSRQNNIYVKNVERVAAAAEGVHKVDEAKSAVASALNHRFANKKIPAAVSVLVDQGWKDLLTQTHIKYGEKSDQWQDYLSVIDQLISFGENPDVPIDIKALLPIIQDGLKQVSGTNEAPSSVREALRQLIVNAPRNKHSMVDADYYDAPEREDDLIQSNLTKSQALKPWIIKAKSSELGAWFKFDKAGQDTQYIRLVWIAKGYSKFVFVNHQGMKVIELGLLKLANYLKDFVITPDWEYEQPMVNQSLDNMVKDVYDKLAYESSHDEGTGLIKRSEFCRQVLTQMRTGKRTAECVLVYLQVMDSNSEPQELRAELAKDIADTLTELVSDAIIGRLNQSDFAVFVVVSGRDIDFSQLKPALLKMYTGEAGISDVYMGESRAHLGFNNPESMIAHAKKALLDKLPGGQENLPELKEKSEIEGSEPSLEASAELDGSIEPNASERSIAEEVEPILETPVANDAEAEPGFEDLKLVVKAQKAKLISQTSGDDEEGESADHINLLCFEDAQGQEYEAFDKEDMQHLDQWWITQLETLTAEQHPLMTDYAYVRVKLSAYALCEEDFCMTLHALAETQAVNASKVVFDVYEGSAIEDLHETFERMKNLIANGYRFCLDHFGSERSPFAFLKALPFFMINIDESYIQSLNEEDADDIAADSIAEIAHYLGKKVLATSVDSAICAQKMKKLKVDYIQGSTVSPIEAI